MSNEEYFRGNNLPIHATPSKIALYTRKEKKIPHIFFFSGNIYFCVSEFAKILIDQLGENQCSFECIELYRGRGSWDFQKAQFGKHIDGNYYIVRDIPRIDTIDWERSEASLEQKWVYKSYTDERVWGTNIIWPAKEGELLGAPYTGLTVRKNLRRGAHIWREHMGNWQFASAIFISDKFKQLIEVEKLGDFDFIPVQEV